MKLRINISIFLVLLLISGGLGMGLESEVLNLEALEIEQTNVSSGGSSSSSKKKTVTEDVYPVEREVREFILGTGTGASTTAKALAGVDPYTDELWEINEVHSENEDIATVVEWSATAGKWVEGISIWGGNEGKTTVTAKVYNENKNKLVIAKIPVTVTNSVYNE